MAAENSSEVQQRSARLVEKLKTKITRADRNFAGSTRHRQHRRPAVRDVDHCIFISLHGITGEQGHGSRPPTPLMRTFPLTNNMAAAGPESSAPQAAQENESRRTMLIGRRSQPSLLIRFLLSSFIIGAGFPGVKEIG
jgi:hypothetical protein